MWQDIELMFNRALKFSFSKRKLFLVFPILILCGILIVLCHTLSVNVNPWLNNSLVFLPTFVCAGIVMGLGILLIRIYHDEVKKKKYSYRHILKQSFSLIAKIPSLSVPLILCYLLLWGVLGLFYLLKEIPGPGEIIGVIFSFGPFLLILGSLLLSAGVLGLLFFMTPKIALKSVIHLNLVEECYQKFKKNFFVHFLLMGLALVPVVSILGALILAATLTGMTYMITQQAWAIGWQWFFIMIPFAAFLTPAVVFFFNFSAESFVSMQKHFKHSYEG